MTDLEADFILRQCSEIHEVASEIPQTYALACIGPNGKTYKASRAPSPRAARKGLAMVVKQWGFL